MKRIGFTLCVVLALSCSLVFAKGQEGVEQRGKVDTNVTFKGKVVLFDGFTGGFGNPEVGNEMVLNFATLGDQKGSLATASGDLRFAHYIPFSGKFKFLKDTELGPPWRGSFRAVSGNDHHKVTVDLVRIKKREDKTTATLWVLIEYEKRISGVLKAEGVVVSNVKDETEK